MHDRVHVFSEAVDSHGDRRDAPLSGAVAEAEEREIVIGRSIGEELPLLLQAASKAREPMRVIFVQYKRASLYVTE